MSDSMRLRSIEREVKRIGSTLEGVEVVRPRTGRPPIIDAGSLNEEKMEAIVAIAEDRWEDLLGMAPVLEAARVCLEAIKEKG